MRVVLTTLFVFLALILSACGQQSDSAVAEAEAADRVLLGGYIYTVDSGQNVIQAVAIKDGLIQAAGSDEEMSAYIGPETEIYELDGRMVLPGLHDSHMHIFGIVEPDSCSFRSQAMTLEAMVPYLQECIQRYELAPGEWLPVDMWSFAEGNQVSAALPDLRTALDAVSSEHPIILWGNDGHHGAANSLALASARDAQSNEVGLSAATLATVFKADRDLVGVRDNGEPNGELNEHIRRALAAPPRRDPEKLGKLLPDMGHVLAINGITSAQDAAMSPAYLPYLKTFEESGDMRFRLQIANRLEPADYTDSLSGQIRVDQMMEDLQQARSVFDGSTLIHGTAVKIFSDGVLEGNPYAAPPTLPNSAVIEPYRQPRFNFDVNTGSLDVVGYVDTASALCEETRANQERFDDPAARAAFRAEHGFHPGQCTISYGVLADPADFMHVYVRKLAEAGFTIHIHAIGDRAVRVAVDALEQVTPADGSNPARHSLAHTQLVHPDDQKRIGQLGLYMAWTYAWMLINPEYDLTVMPFLSDVTTEAGIYDPNSYHMKNSYPVRSILEAGGVTAAGSDAPVEDRSPRPFINMAIGVTRQGSDGNVLNVSEAIDIYQMIAAYTINGARALKQEDITGSIEVGKKADLAVLDRNIIELYEAGNGMGIAETQVDATFFDGELIYQRE
ncbi:MAG: amidohydrolase family protein [Xanthomonadales bacterium]|nr:amidohydrolase family protein [Xanthomonadales bacterium]